MDTLEMRITQWLESLAVKVATPKRFMIGNHLMLGSEYVDKNGLQWLYLAGILPKMYKKSTILYVDEYNQQWTSGGYFDAITDDNRKFHPYGEHIHLLLADNPLNLNNYHVIVSMCEIPAWDNHCAKGNDNA